MGLRPAGCGIQEQREKGVVAEICAGKQVQHRPGLRHSDEPRGMGGFRPCGRLQRPADGLQGLQGPLPRRQAD